MLQFFRKYQKIVFLCVTVVIIFSFVFFGTYQAFVPQKQQEKQSVVYVTTYGKKIGSRYMRQLVQFLQTEGVSGRDFFETNFLNDGIVSSEFVETGLAQMIFKQHPELFKEDLTLRLEQEKSYEPYRHPFSKQISARAVWKLFAPELEQNLEILQKTEDALSEQALQARLHLYQAQQRFPAQFLANMLRYQERDLAGLHSDPKLQRGEVALFGYHNLEDWFGAAFMDQVAKVVIETVAFAQKKGYKVSEDEARSEMLYKSQKLCDVLKENGERLPIAADGRLLLQLFIRQTGFDETTLVRIYRDLMLFKRFLNDAAESVMPDPLAFESFYARAGESVTLEVSQMPQPLRFQTVDELKEFECYLAALGGKSSHPLLLPQQISPRPELVGTSYQLYVGCVENKKLEAKVSVKETWRWQEKNWPLLQQEFSWLKAEGQPLECLDALDAKRRAMVDHFARQRIASEHPEWMEETLKNVEMKPLELFLAKKDASSSLVGIDNLSALQQQLDEKEELFNYTQDGEHVYRILVLERRPDTCLSFQQARQAGIIAKLKNESESETHVRQVLAQIGRDMATLGIQVSEEQALWYRFYRQLTEAPDALEQFQPVKQLMTVTRAEPRFFNFDQMMTAQEGRGAAQAEGVYLYQVQERVVDKTLPLDKIVQAGDLLSGEVRHNLLKQMFEKLSEPS